MNFISLDNNMINLNTIDIITYELIIQNTETFKLIKFEDVYYRSALGLFDQPTISRLGDSREFTFVASACNPVWTGVSTYDTPGEGNQTLLKILQRRQPEVFEEFDTVLNILFKKDLNTIYTKQLAKQTQRYDNYFTKKLQTIDKDALQQLAINYISNLVTPTIAL